MSNRTVAKCSDNHQNRCLTACAHMFHIEFHIRFNSSNRQTFSSLYQNFTRVSSTGEWLPNLRVQTNQFLSSNYRIQKCALTYRTQFIIINKCYAYVIEREKDREKRERKSYHTEKMVRLKMVLDFLNLIL